MQPDIKSQTEQTEQTNYKSQIPSIKRVQLADYYLSSSDHFCGLMLVCNLVLGI